MKNKQKLFRKSERDFFRIDNRLTIRDQLLNKNFEFNLYKCIELQRKIVLLRNTNMHIQKFM